VGPPFHFAGLDCTEQVDDLRFCNADSLLPASVRGNLRPTLLGRPLRFFFFWVNSSFLYLGVVRSFSGHFVSAPAALILLGFGPFSPSTFRF